MQVATPKRASAISDPIAKRHFTAFEPLNDTARHRNTRHLDTATENHETYCRKFS